MLVPALALGLLASDGPAPRLRWDAPPSCPTASEVQRRLDQWVGEMDGATLWADARVDAHEDGFVVRVRMVSATGSDERSFSGEHCELLADAVVFVVAVAIDPVTSTGAAVEDPVSMMDEGEPEPSVHSTAETDAKLEVEVEAMARATPKASSSVRESSGADVPRPERVPVAGGIRVASSVGAGVLPGLDVLLGGAGIVRGPSFRAELVLQHGFARAARLDAFDTAGADLDQWTALGRGCWAHPRRRLEFDLCGQLEAGAVRARGVGVQDARTRWSSFVGLGIAAGLALRLVDRLALWIDGQGFGSPRRPAFSVAGSDQRLHAAAAGGGRISVGLELRLGHLR